MTAYIDCFVAFAPRNDGACGAKIAQDDSIYRLLRRFAPRNDGACGAKVAQDDT